MASIRWRLERRGAAGDEAGLGGKLVATLFFGIFLGLGLFFVAMIGREALRAAETFGWDERHCAIERSTVIRDSGENPYRAVVDYRTIDAGATLAGNRIQRRPLSFDSHGDAARRLAAYPVGATVSCWVSPTGEAVLERGPLWIGLWVLLPLVFVAIGGGGLVVTWRPVRKDRLGRTLPEPLGKAAARARPGRALAGFGLAFAALGGLVFWFVGALPLARVHAARSWDPQSCTVEQSSVVSHSSDDGTTYSVDILYRWDRGRGVERSSRYSFFGGSSSGRAGKAAIVRAHPRGADVPCWVDPERRNEAVLERGLTLHALVALVPLAFVVAGGAMVVVGRRRRARRDHLRQRARLGQAPFAADDPVYDALPTFDVATGPVALEARSSRWGRLLGFTAMTLFWNGIVGVFVHQAWQGFARGRPDWFLVLFLVPFVLAGLGFVAALVHSLLALGNARPDLVASTRTPRLGERLDLQWRLRGRTDSLTRVRITLKGREQATYQVGTHTRTASEDFFERVLVDAPAPTCAMGGHATVSVPDTAMHSFESAHNQVIWELELVGEIRRWPDVKETYPLVVLPLAPGGAKREDRRP